MTPTSDMSHRDDENEIYLIDLLLILSTNLKTLIILPLLGFLCAMSFIAWQTNKPKIYISTSTLVVEKPTSENLKPNFKAAEVIVSTINTNEVFHKLSKNNETITASLSHKDRLVKVSTSGASPQDAQSLNHQALQKLYEITALKGVEADRLQHLLKNERERLAEIHSLLRATPSGAKNSPESVRSYGELLNIASSREFAITKIEDALAGLSVSNIVIEPTLPSAAQPVKKLLPILAGLIAGGFIALLWIFLRHSLKTVKNDPQSNQKLQQIKHNIGWR